MDEMETGGEGAAPGWMYAEGDPPGTHRYWNGLSWEGDPKPASAPAVPGGTPSTAAHGMPLAGLGDRFIANLIDIGVAIGLYIAITIVSFILGAISSTLGTLFSLVGFLVMLGYVIYNYGYGLGESGQTPGKRMMGVKIIDKATGSTIGGGKGVMRLLARGFLNTIFCGLPISDLWGVFDANNEGLHDKVLSTNAVSVPKGSFMPIFHDGNPF